MVGLFLKGEMMVWSGLRLVSELRTHSYTHLQPVLRPVVKDQTASDVATIAQFVLGSNSILNWGEMRIGDASQSVYKLGEFNMQSLGNSHQGIQ
jgi:hypothetical protein